MELFYRKIGEGKPLVVLHGVFGSSDNLVTAAKAIAEHGFAVYLLDARNHGQSPRAEAFNYQVMGQDLHEFIQRHELDKPILMGHSMGGKVIMQYAMHYHDFGKLIIVDIAPKSYRPHHQHILDGLNAVNLTTLQSRKEAEEIVLPYIPDFGERQFLLKNLYRTDAGGFDWRINLPVITREIVHVGEELQDVRQITEPTLFIRGSLSRYIKDEDLERISEIFINSQVVTIEGANHWVHAVKPAEFVETVVKFAN